MWITKLKLMHKDCPIVTRCSKFKVIVLSYPQTWYEKNKVKFATTTCYFQSAEDAKKKQFLEDLRTDARISNLEISGDIFTYEIKLGKKAEHVMLYYTNQIFFVKPVVNHYDSYEYWEVAAWKKEELQRFISELKKHMDTCMILKLQQTPLVDIYFPNVMPSLSISQRKALELAYKEGYYSYPRKITLEKLAKLAKISLSTYQEHLRKAELKLLPAIVEYQMKNA